jgi:hypothetical protein
VDLWFEESTREVGAYLYNCYVAIRVCQSVAVGNWVCVCRMSHSRIIANYLGTTGIQITWPKNGCQDNYIEQIYNSSETTGFLFYYSGGRVRAKSTITNFSFTLVNY